METQDIGLVNNKEWMAKLPPSTQYVLIGCGCAAAVGSVIIGLFLYRYFKKADGVIDQQIQYKINQNLEQPKKFYNPLFDGEGKDDPFANDFDQ